MSIRWIRNVLVDGQQATLEVMLGNHKIADKCYVRVDDEEENWFIPSQEHRDAILAEGIAILKSRLTGRDVKAQTGAPFSWN